MLRDTWQAFWQVEFIIDNEIDAYASKPGVL
jgi:hypothetical protein